MPVNSSNLSAFELLHRENLFIRLKNQGKNLDEIAMLLDVEKELVEQWNENKTKIEKNTFSTVSNEEITPLLKKLIQKDWANPIIIRKQSYKQEYDFMFKDTLLSSLVLSLDAFIDANDDYFKNIFALNNNGIKKIKAEAKIAYDTILEYYDDISNITVKKEGEVFKVSIKLLRNSKNNSSEVINKINQSFQFALEYTYGNILEEEEFFTFSNDTISPNGKYYQALPYAIKQLRIESYHHIQDILIENLNIDAQWIFLFGENGFGKTSILQSIAICLLGNEEQNKHLTISSDTDIHVEFSNYYYNQINIYDVNYNSSTENLVCYGSSRLNVGKDDTKEDEMQKSSLTYSLFHTDGILLNIEKYLKEWFLAKDERFGKVIEAFKTIIPYLHDIQVIRDEKTREFEVHYFEKIIDETGEPGSTQKVPFDHLAAGLKSVLAMVGDMFIRLYRTQPLVNNPSELVGIAIIDELELHLHPKWQIKLPQLLSTVFPKVQFIVSTHSAIPLLGATPNAVFIKVTRDKENGIQAKKMDIDLKNLTPNQLFYFLFDMESITSVNNTNLAEVRTEDTKAEFLQNDEVKRRLKAFETKKADIDFPDDLFEPENSVVK